MPKDNEISKPIRELVCILLSHKEKDKKGIRHGDSRQAKTTDMENLIEVLSEWSETPQDFFRLAITLLDKNKNLDIYLKIKQFKITYKIYIST